MKDACPECGDEYKALAQHWRYSPEHRPDFSDYQKEVITGVLMGDGNIDSHTGGRPRLRVTSITKPYLDLLDDILGIHSLGVELKTTAEEAVERNIETGFSPNADVNDYSDLYELRTRNSPNLEQFSNWYDSGHKIWPDVELTPTILKHLYVCDGSLNKTSGQVHISCSNELDRKNKLEQRFESAGLQINNWNDKVRDVNGYEGTVSTSLVINKSNTDEFFEYIGQPLPGFEYKWPERYK